MKFAFFGTPEFAAIVLGRLIEHGFTPSFVVTNPDRPFGRKKIVTAPPVKHLIGDNGWNIEIFQPEKNEVESLVEKLRTVDFAVVAAYTNILPKKILEAPRLGFIGVHPSLLPKYRGATPIQSAILAGETETGVTLYRMDEKVDHGGIFTHRALHIENTDTYETLERKLAKIGGDLLSEIIPKLETFKTTKQDESLATMTKKFKTEDGYIEPADLEKAKTSGGHLALVLDRKIRALNPEPGAYTIQGGKRIKLLEARVESGLLRLSLIQREGGMPVRV